MRNHSRDFLKRTISLLANCKFLRLPSIPKDGRPLPILNTSLNVVRGKELALQSRKARSFALTPIHGGFTRVVQDKRRWDAFYAPTEKLACKLPGFKHGVTLGTAVAISGAAASPNMGSYSEPGLGFLMTLFDVRLGWWIGNPSGKGWQNGSPELGFACLLQELLGTTNDESKYVYLSDGGHFENLAIYELVRRRCKLIIASDASCDSEYTFGDLHNADGAMPDGFRRGDCSAMTLKKSPPNRLPVIPRHSGPKHILPSEGFGTAPILLKEDGTIIYLKPALVHSDPCDVLAYAKKDKSFPHDTTANQWFDEAHFENYRALGEASASAASEEIASEIRRILG